MLTSFFLQAGILGFSLYFYFQFHLFCLSLHWEEHPGHSSFLTCSARGAAPVEETENVGKHEEKIIDKTCKWQCLLLASWREKYHEEKTYKKKMTAESQSPEPHWPNFWLLSADTIIYYIFFFPKVPEWVSHRSPICKTILWI